MYLQAKENSESSSGSIRNIRTIHNYAKKALDGNPSDSKVKEFYNEVKLKFDEFNEELKKQAQEV